MNRMNTDEHTTTQADTLYRRDVLSCMTVCVVADPGEDDNPDPDDYPEEHSESPPDVLA